MVERLEKTLILNGAIILFIGMLYGIPYALVIWLASGSEAERDWSAAHDATIIGGILLLVLGAMLSRLKLRDGQFSTLAWSFIISFYCFALALLLEALYPSAGLLPDTGPVFQVIVGSLSTVAGITSFIGGWLLIVGSYKAFGGDGSEA